MSSSMEQLYQQVILDHARDPHGRGLVDGPAGAVAGESHQVNPTCGDEVTLQVATLVAQTAWDLYQDPTLVEAAWREHRGVPA